MPAVRTHHLVRVAILAASWLATTSPQAADPPPGHAGGLMPDVPRPRVGMTREELIREWDLDGDGSISKPEADVARGRMRRMRIEAEAGAGIDPITGKARNLETPDGAAADADDGPVFQLPPEPLPTADRGRRSPLGGRPPESIPGSGAAPPIAGPGGQPKSNPATTPPVTSSRASWLPPRKDSPLVTGGVRAGAPAAQPGYGAVIWSDLNAGRRAATNQPTDGQPQADAPQTSGGLMPTGRLPGRSGAMLLPKMPRQSPLPPAAPRTVVPAPTVEPPQVSADELGGDRP